MSKENFNIGINLDNENKVELTSEGKKNLEVKLSDLINNERPKIQIELAEARSQGDLSENAEYDAAKDKQAEIETEILRIEDLLARAKVIEKQSNSNEITLGSIITYKKDNKEKTIELVPDVESSPLLDIPKIGINSSFSHFVLGHEVGDKIVINIDKPYKIEITKIS